MSKQDTHSMQSLPVDDVENEITNTQADGQSVDAGASVEVSDTPSDPPSAQQASSTGASELESSEQAPAASEAISAISESTTASAGVVAAATSGLSGGAIAAIVAGVLLVVAVVAGVVAFNPTASPDVANVQQQLGIDPNAGIFKEPEPEPVSSGIAIPGWAEIKIPAGQTAVSVNFNNPDANADKFYLSFELKLKDSGEVLYTSALVPPGQTIQNVTLSRPLEAGKYDAIMRVQPYKMDATQAKTNNADMATVLIVE